MDSTQPIINCVEWFFGYGGNHLGLKRVEPGLRCVAASEIESYAVANMVSKMEAGHMDPFPIWTDCKTFPCEIFRGMVDLFIASYPCQSYSAAGKREGISDPRFLWPWVVRAIIIIRPRRVFLENVAGHVSLGLSTVISDLEGAGYRVEAGLFSAEEVGAPHERKRVFIMADSRREHHERRGVGGKLGSASGSPEREARQWERCGDAAGDSGTENQLADTARARGGLLSKSEGRNADRDANGASSAMADASSTRLEGRSEQSNGEECSPTERSGDLWPARPGYRQHEWEALRVVRVNLDVLRISERHNVDFDTALRTLQRFLKRGVDRATDGFERELADYSEFLRVRVDALRLCGNGVVPATAELAYRTLAGRLNTTL